MTSQLRVLVVEDSPGVLHFCREVLTLAGFVVDAADSASAARRLYAASRPDLALIDYGLPDGTGLDLLREWNAGTPPLPPMLFLSGRDELSVRLACFQAGARDYVVKPCAPQELVARVRVHLELKRSQDELASRNEQLELITRAKKDMADMIVHDLKAPLSSIKGTLQLVAMQGLITETGHDSLLHEAGSAADFMLLMLNDLLDVGAAKEGRLIAELGPVDVPKLLQKLKALFRDRLEASGVALRLEVAPACAEVRSDQNLLYRILANLLAEAVKASDSGQSVELECSRVDGRLRFAVSDRCGQASTTERRGAFERTDWADAASGFGLSFSRAAAQAMKGKLTFEVREGGGARFVLELPA